MMAQIFYIDYNHWIMVLIRCSNIPVSYRLDFWDSMETPFDWGLSLMGEIHPWLLPYTEELLWVFIVPGEESIHYVHFTRVRAQHCTTWLLCLIQEHVRNKPDLMVIFLKKSDWLQNRGKLNEFKKFQTLEHHRDTFLHCQFNMMETLFMVFADVCEAL